MLTKKFILSRLPIFRSELIEHCPEKRHVKRLDKILTSLKRKGQIKELSVEETLSDDKGKVFKKVTTHYSQS
jgi:hypothetical protein